MIVPYDREMEVALQAVREAARLCRAVRSKPEFGVLDKADLSPVTVADYGSQALVCRALAEALPADPIIGEEDAADLRRDENAAVRDAVLAAVQPLRPEAELETVLGWIDRGGAAADSGRFWTLDPIDGTKGFLRDEQYAVALALLVDGKPVLGVLACPNLTAPDGSTGALFAAVEGQGAFALPLDGDGPRTPIQVSGASDTASARFCESVESGHSAHGAAAEIAKILNITSPPVRLDSQAKYAIVGRGEAEIYLRLPTRADYREKIWDHAAGAMIVAEAGGKVTDVDGKPLDFSRGRSLQENRGVIVTNGPLHERVLKAVRKVGV